MAIAEVLVSTITSDHFQFDSVFIKKNNQINFIFFQKNQNQFKPTGFCSVTLE
jgi:hypothetical protein